MDYKTEYTDAELAALAKWYADHLKELPQSFQFDDATRIPDLHDTVRIIIGILEKPTPNIAFSGQFYQFFCLRDKLETEINKKQS